MYCHGELALNIIMKERCWYLENLSSKIIFFIKFTHNFTSCLQLDPVISRYIVVSKKTSIDLSHKVNIAAADDLETQGVRASSVAMVLIYMYTIYSDLKENKHRSFIQSQYRSCWWPRDTWSQSIISSHDIDLHVHWNWYVILTKFSTLAALEVTILTTSGAASDENFFKMTFSFRVVLPGSNLNTRKVKHLRRNEKFWASLYWVLSNLLDLIGLGLKGWNTSRTNITHNYLILAWWRYMAT